MNDFEIEETKKAVGSMSDFSTSLERVTAAFARLVDTMRFKQERMAARSVLVGPMSSTPFSSPPFKIDNCEYCQAKKSLFAYAWTPPPNRDYLGRKWFYCDDCATLLRARHV